MQKNLMIFQIAEYLGIKLDERDPHDSFMWDGFTIGIGGQSDSNIIHEISHWLLSPSWRRKIVDFGLGSGPETGNTRKANLAEVSSDHFLGGQSSFEESCASLLGIAFEAALGLDFNKTFEDHEWYNDVGEDNFWIIVAKLNEFGLLENHYPTVLNEI